MDAKSGKKWQKLDKNMQIPTWELKKKAIEPALELNPLSNLTRTKKVQIYIEPAGSIRDFTVFMCIFLITLVGSGPIVLCYI